MQFADVRMSVHHVRTADQEQRRKTKMRETFEEVYLAFKRTNFKEELKIVANAMIYFTVPLWIIPYAIVRKIKEMFNGN